MLIYKQQIVFVVFFSVLVAGLWRNIVYCEMRKEYVYIKFKNGSFVRKTYRVICSALLIVGSNIIIIVSAVMVRWMRFGGVLFSYGLMCVCVCFDLYIFAFRKCTRGWFDACPNVGTNGVSLHIFCGMVGRKTPRNVHTIYVRQVDDRRGCLLLDVGFLLVPGRQFRHAFMCTYTEERVRSNRESDGYNAHCEANQFGKFTQITTNFMLGPLTRHRPAANRRMEEF